MWTRLPEGFREDQAQERLVASGQSSEA